MIDDRHILEARDLHKSYGAGPARVRVLRGLDLAVRAGEFLAVMGPSGCGKSTLLHVLGLMSAPDEGEVFIDGRPVSALPAPAQAEVRKKRIGFVFQRFNLIGVLSGLDNILLSLRIRGLDGRGEVNELLEAMGVAAIAGRKPAGLSIGEQQRFAVARAIAGRPGLILADEPTGSLDSANAAAVLDLLVRANRRYGQTVVMITHSAEVAQAAGRIARMKDGRIVNGTA